MSVWDGDKPFVLAAGRPATTIEPVHASAAIQGDFAGFVLDGKRLHLRVVKYVEAGSHHLTVISNVPVTPQLLRIAASQLGSIAVLPPDEEDDKKPASDAASGGAATTPKSSSRAERYNLNKDQLNIDVGNTHSTVSLSGENAGSRVEAGRVPPPQTPSTCTFPSPPDSARLIGIPESP